MNNNDTAMNDEFPDDLQNISSNEMHAAEQTARALGEGNVNLRTDLATSTNPRQGSDDGSQRQTDELRLVAYLLRQATSKEDKPATSPATRKAVEQALSGTPTERAKPTHSRSWFRWTYVAAVAAILLMFVTGLQYEQYIRRQLASPQLVLNYDEPSKSPHQGTYNTPDDLATATPANPQVLTIDTDHAQAATLPPDINVAQTDRATDKAASGHSITWSVSSPNDAPEEPAGKQRAQREDLQRLNSPDGDRREPNTNVEAVAEKRFKAEQAYQVATERESLTPRNERGTARLESSKSTLARSAPQSLEAQMHQRHPVADRSGAERYDLAFRTASPTPHSPDSRSPPTDVPAAAALQKPGGERYYQRRKNIASGRSSEKYDPIVENPYQDARQHPLSTFSVDVDTASYANVRRFLTGGQLPPEYAVRIEEFVNYFGYNYAPPEGQHPFSVDMEVAICPWNEKHRLLRVALAGKQISSSERGPCNLVFLLDVSGSMQDNNKLPLVQRAMKMLADQLTENDRVTIVTYAGEAGVRLPPTGGHDKKTLHSAINALQAGGSTNGSAGIQMAYDLAAEHLIAEGVNRVILATDGDLNVGVTSNKALVELIQQRAAKDRVFLTVLGFGTGNLKDSKLEHLADYGNGVYRYIDNLQEARRTLVQQMSSNLVAIAKDVKLQVDFNYATVAAYRLIGYENRILENEDFSNDVMDAGELGAGDRVTALYELIPVGEHFGQSEPATSRYQRLPSFPEPELTEQAASGELLTLAIRYKRPTADVSQQIETEFTLRDDGKSFAEASEDFRFAAAVAGFGMLLRHSEFSGNATLTSMESIASAALGDDMTGERTELLDLIRKADQLKSRRH